MHIDSIEYTIDSHSQTNIMFKKSEIIFLDKTHTEERKTSYSSVRCVR